MFLILIKAFLEFSIRGALARPFSCRSANARPYACSAVRASYRELRPFNMMKRRGAALFSASIFIYYNLSFFWVYSSVGRALGF